MSEGGLNSSVGFGWAVPCFNSMVVMAKEDKMSTIASNFAVTMKHTWAALSRTYKSEDANVRVKEWGRELVGCINHPDFIHEEGDMPASLWQFPDGSRIIIGDDGSFIKAAGTRSQQERMMKDSS